MTIDIDESKVERNPVSLWLSWTLATAVGMLLGFVPASLVVDNIDLGLARVFVPLVAGLLVGLLQWVVLRPYLVQASDWILAGAAGWAVGFALGLVVIQTLSGSPIGAITGYLLFGVIIGLIQWPVLRREIPNALSWVLASIVGWAAGLLVAQLALSQFFGDNPIHPVVTSAISAGVSGLIAGAITGWAFVQIVRQPERISVKRV
jgi:hypothetical protein